MASRQCTRGDDDGQALSNAEPGLLERAGTGSGVRMLVLTEAAALAMARVLDHGVQGNTAQLADPAFGWVFTAKGENDKIVRQVRSSAGLAVFIDRAHAAIVAAQAGRGCAVLSAPWVASERVSFISSTPSERSR